ncbi:hypothetical protein CALCODRAFT_228310 [Calocera cornea HHB12733]|uniref:Uncharacterized protein n=1 Tax=Calocera cornea HHB12733 TaxID=1353952 RepID=A0A165H339_9BASI|nr:hypothetical protein CALCODRAFT_228310 [Calocera cornea HHB12733]
MNSFTLSWFAPWAAGLRRVLRARSVSFAGAGAGTLHRSARHRGPLFHPHSHPYPSDAPSPHRTRLLFKPQASASAPSLHRTLSQEQARTMVLTNRSKYVQGLGTPPRPARRVARYGGVPMRRGGQKRWTPPTCEFLETTVRLRNSYSTCWASYRRGG